jgi:apolipoprotein N-acyltransferase
MMKPMARMFGYGLTCGMGICNLLWMVVDFHDVSFVFAVFTMVLLSLLYLDYLRYYEEKKA